MKKFKIDVIFFSIVLIVLMILGVSMFWFRGCNEAKAASPKVSIFKTDETPWGHTMNGVWTIDVTDWSRYIVDTRFDTCFYETFSQHGLAVTNISETYACVALLNRVPR